MKKWMDEHPILVWLAIFLVIGVVWALIGGWIPASFHGT
jgi:hypothetical protein